MHVICCFFLYTLPGLSMKTKRKSVPLIDREHSNTTVSVSHQLTNVDESVSVTSVDFVVLGSCVVSGALVIYHLLVCFSFRYKLDTVTAGQNFTKIRKAIITTRFFFHAIVKNQPVYVHPSSVLFPKTTGLVHLL